MLDLGWELLAMLGRHLFTLDGERFLLVDAFSRESGAEWQLVPEREAAFVVASYLRRNPDDTSRLARIIDGAHDVVTSATQRSMSARALRDELLRDVGRLVLFRRDPPSLRVPPPRDLDPLVLADVIAPDPLTFITFELCDQTGMRLASIPYELAVDGEVADAGVVTLGHVHRDELTPGSSGTLSFPEPAAVLDQTFKLRLADGNGAGIGGQRFELLLADGSTRSGVLDDSGSAELSNLPRGKALLSFPDPIDGVVSLTAGVARKAEAEPAETEPIADAESTPPLAPAAGGGGANTATASPVVATPLTQPSSLDVTVQDAQGTPLAGRAFALLLPDGSERTGVLDSAGTLSMKDLPAGDVQFRLLKQAS